LFQRFQRSVGCCCDLRGFSSFKSENAIFPLNFPLKVRIPASAFWILAFGFWLFSFWSDDLKTNRVEFLLKNCFTPSLKTVSVKTDS
jgi:hypothetical protein